MFKKILIANRGEISCRISKTARKLGIKTVAIFSDADKDAKHVQMCDEAYKVGNSEAKDSYLNIEKIVDIAKRSKCEALHPGYGFLSENHNFAKKCVDNKIIFIGPSPESIKLMGSKEKSKKILEKHGIPVIPGFYDEQSSLGYVRSMAKKIGYPLLIKASAGGGGKGMRIVKDQASLKFSIESSKREAKSSFGEDKIIFEKYITNPRHIEIQIFSDKFGNYLNLFERDCSVQRRYQKIIEESPAPGLSKDIIKKIGNMAINVAKSINYEGAGTVEFILSPNGEFYFMEMNTRLQVEHPVTEMVTGIDLVEMQFIVADGGKLPLSQNDLKSKGHAIEARIYAEKPNDDFLPSVGKLSYLIEPENSNDIRIDSGIKKHDEIGRYYDPMLSKLISWGKNRSLAIQNLKRALTKYEIVGIETNIEFLENLIDCEDFRKAEQKPKRLNTNLINKNEKNLYRKKRISNIIFVLAYINQFLKENKKNIYPWRLNLIHSEDIEYEYDSRKFKLKISYLKENKIEAKIFSESYLIESMLKKNNIVVAMVNGIRFKSKVIEDQKKIHIFFEGFNFIISKSDKHFNNIDEDFSSLKSELPGTVLKVFVKVGDLVKKNSTLMIIEAMKMEHAIIAPKDGIIEDVFFSEGDAASEGAQLLKFKD